MWKLYLGSLAFTRVIVLINQIPSVANSVLERFFSQFQQNNTVSVLRIVIGRCLCAIFNSKIYIFQERSSNNERLKKWNSREPLVLDAGALGDLPAVYRIAPVQPHQFPVIGVYIDPRVLTGFRYKVKPLPVSYSFVLYLESIFFISC